MRQYPDWSLYRTAQKVHHAMLDTARDGLTVRENSRRLHHYGDAGRRAMWLLFGLALVLVAALDIGFTLFTR